MVKLTESDGLPVYWVRTKPWERSEERYYISTGVHGDEPAGVLGLVEWVELRAEQLRDRAFVFFPCMNPWGVENNSRLDGKGRDLNRRFDHRTDPRIRTWKKVLEGGGIRRALCLHEDYDAMGTYVYEHGRGDGRIGGDVLGACADVIGPDPRKRIEGWRAEGGLVRVPKKLPKIPGGMPEGIALHVLGVERTLTVEMPSEFSLYDRVRAYVKVLDRAFLS